MTRTSTAVDWLYISTSVEPRIIRDLSWFLPLGMEKDIQTCKYTFPAKKEEKKRKTGMGCSFYRFSVYQCYPYFLFTFIVFNLLQIVKLTFFLLISQPFCNSIAVRLTPCLSLLHYDLLRIIPERKIEWERQRDKDIFFFKYLSLHLHHVKKCICKCCYYEPIGSYIISDQCFQRWTIPERFVRKRGSDGGWGKWTVLL